MPHSLDTLRIQGGVVRTIALCTILTGMPICLGGSSHQDDDALPPRVGEMLRTEGLTEFERTHYPLLVFARSANNKVFLDQMSRFQKARDELAKHKVVVAAIFEYQGGQVGKQPIDMTDASTLRRRYRVDDGAMEIILVGKDGAEKWRHRGPIEAKDLLDQIQTLQDGEAAR